MKKSHWLFKRGETYYLVEAATGRQTSLRTKSPSEAADLLAIKLGGKAPPRKRTWSDAMRLAESQRSGTTQARAITAFKSHAFDPLRELLILETTADDLLGVLEDGKYSTSKFLKMIHGIAVDMGWSKSVILPLRVWPARKHKKSRAITREEHERILRSVRRRVPTLTERRLFYQLLWETGASSHDASRLTASDIDWKRRVLVFRRAKTNTQSVVGIGKGLEEVLRALPAEGQLFKTISQTSSVDRASEFNRRCRACGIEGVTLHSYRYAWAERAYQLGYPERYAQAALGHSSQAMHHAYARGAQVECPPLDDFITLTQRVPDLLTSP